MKDFTVVIYQKGSEIWSHKVSGYLSGAQTISVPFVQGDMVKIKLTGSNAVLSLAEVEVYGRIDLNAPTLPPVTTPTNVALSKPTAQSSTGYGGSSSRAVDGNTDGNWNRGSVTHTNHESNPYWQVDLEEIYKIDTIVVYNRNDCCSIR